MQKSEYRQVSAISQSAIKAFRKMSLSKFKEIYIDKVSDDEETTDSLTFGSLVDTLAFEPALLNERFYIPGYEPNIPGDKVKLIVERVYRKAKEVIDNKILLNEQGNVPEPLYIPNIHDLSEFNDLTIKFAREIKYGGDKWSTSRILDNVYEDGSGYFQHLAEASGRSIISTIESADANQMVENLRNHPRSMSYFVQQEGEILLHQQEIYEDYNYENVIIALKAAVDIIRIVPAEKAVYLPDLKTAYDVNEFPKNAEKYEYGGQMSFYRFMVQRFLQTFKGGVFKDFTIHTPFDIVIDRDNKVPYIYGFDEGDLYIYEYGSKKFKGWRQILDEIGWHIKNEVWNEPKELYETGKIKLKFFND
jgi:hypothetical protein